MAAVKFSKQPIKPNPLEVDYWVDITSNPYGGRIMYHNGVDWVDLLNANGEPINMDAYYNKLQINQMLALKASVYSVESKVDDSEIADVIKNIEFKDRGNGGIEMIILKYDDATVGVTMPIASNTTSGVVTASSFKDLVKQNQLLQLYSVFYDTIANIRSQYQPRLSAGENITIDRTTNTIHAVNKLPVDWNKLTNIPDNLVASIDTNDAVTNVDELLISQFLRKNEQLLTPEELTQVRTNIGVVSLEENVAFKTEMTESNEAFKTEVLENMETYKTDTTERLNEEFAALQSSVDKSIQSFEESLEAMENLFYGIEFDMAVSTNAIVRIGNVSFHRSLPIHEKMRGCLLDDNGDVVKYLDKSSWTEEIRDGSMGQVMVEIPDIYWRFEEEGTKRRAMISTLPLPDFFLVPKHYVSAYEASVQHSTKKLCSLVNSDVDYRGGNNTASYDGTYRSLLGRPATSISRTNFRNYARKRKEGSTEWNCMTYDVHKWIYWLFVIEYATLNSQAAYNAELDANGYRQGGLGAGVTTWDDTSWSNFNGYNPFVPCGHTDGLGNGTGTVAYEVLDAEGAVLKIFNVPRYRGIENPFGHIWQWTDGVNVRISPTVENGGDGLSKVFVCSDTSKFSSTGYEGYSHVGNEARSNGYAKSHIFGEYGEIIPDAVGGGSTTYLCDFHFTEIPTSETLRGVYFSGSARDATYAGFVTTYSHTAPSYTHARIGSRLCFIPNQKTE